jgi:putative addiction module component (TIGR02574 family)
MADQSFDFEKYSPEERLELIERLWDSLNDKAAAVSITDEQRAELDRRLDDPNENAGGIPWDEVARQIRARRG